LVIGHGDAAKLTDPVVNFSAAFGMDVVSPPADATVGEGDVYEAAGLRLEVIETPGHSIGHVAFVVRPFTPMRVFSGDVLFRGGIGRYDLHDADFEQLRASIQDKLFQLPDDTIIFPGHGPPTTIGHEKRTNPFIGEPAGYRIG
jgi:glyoxylase-like metal-dependent hydrolase (beta-lactamase superfamily II)